MNTAPETENNAVSISAQASSKIKQKWEGWNLLVLAGHHVILRLAWIFKTETVIMPAFLDVIAGAGWIRGCLPILNRIGQSVAPILCSPLLKNSRRKVTMLFVTTLLMSALFGTLAGFCTLLGKTPLPWFPFLFLGIYAVFFAATGVNQLSFNTLQGKLVRPQRRGRLMSVAGMAGSVVAMTAAWMLLARWLAIPDGRGFSLIFGFTSVAFFVSACSLFLLKEPPDEKRKTVAHPVVLFQNVANSLKNHRDLRKAAGVAMLFICSLLLFPHYQWLGRTALGAGAADLMMWVVLQNASVGIFSLIAGTCADRFGYRIVMRVEIFLVAIIPVTALFLAEFLSTDQRGWYTLTFILLGLCPVTMKTIYNYVLELADEEDHPHYLSTISLCMAVPLFSAPLIGLLVDWNAVVTFSLIAVLVLLGGAMTFSLNEPRLNS